MSSAKPKKLVRLIGLEYVRLVNDLFGSFWLKPSGLFGKVQLYITQEDNVWVIFNVMESGSVYIII